MTKLAVSMAIVLTTSILISSTVSADNSAAKPSLKAVTTAKIQSSDGGNVETGYVTVYESGDRQTKSTTAKLKPKGKLNGKSSSTEANDDEPGIIACPASPEFPIEPDNDDTVVFSEGTLTIIDMDPTAGNADINMGDGDHVLRVNQQYDSITIAATDAYGNPENFGTESITLTNVVSMSWEKIKIELGGGTYKIVDAIIYEITDGSQVIPASADKNANFCVYSYKYNAKSDTYVTKKFVNYPKLTTLGVKYTAEDAGMLSQFGIYSKDPSKLKGSMVGTDMFLRIVPKK